MKTEDKILSTSLVLINHAIKANIKLAKTIEKQLIKKERDIFRNMARQHSDILNLLETVMKKHKSGILAESYYECVERLIKQTREA